MTSLPHIKIGSRERTIRSSTAHCYCCLVCDSFRVIITASPKVLPFWFSASGATIPLGQLCKVYALARKHNCNFRLESVDFYVAGGRPRPSCRESVWILK